MKFVRLLKTLLLEADVSIYTFEGQWPNDLDSIV